MTQQIQQTLLTLVGKLCKSGGGESATGITKV